MLFSLLEWKVLRTAFLEGPSHSKSENSTHSQRLSDFLEVSSHSKSENSIHSQRLRDFYEEFDDPLTDLGYSGVPLGGGA